MVTKQIVVSDHDELLAVLRNSFFEREGFRLVLVGAVEDGCLAVERDAPALAIFDLSACGANALAFCRRVKADPLLAATPVMLVLPDAPGAELADVCWASGCDALAERPLAAGQVLDAACALLGISRRLARRFPVDFHLEYLAAGAKHHAGTAVNLNQGGMFLAADQLFPVDTRLKLHFTLPGLRLPLQCEARVAWVNHPEWRKKSNLPCGMGVEFTDPGPTVLKALREFIDSLSLRS